MNSLFQRCVYLITSEMNVSWQGLRCCRGEGKAGETPHRGGSGGSPLRGSFDFVGAMLLSQTSANLCASGRLGGSVQHDWPATQVSREVPGTGMVHPLQSLGFGAKLWQGLGGVWTLGLGMEAWHCWQRCCWAVMQCWLTTPCLRNPCALKGDSQRSIVSEFYVSLGM